MDLNKLKITKEQGAIGVLTLWLTYTTWDLQSIRSELSDCYKDQINTSSVHHQTGFNAVAVIPKRSKIITVYND